MDGRPAGATQERLPSALSKGLAAAHGLAGRSPASAEEGRLLFTPGILPSALRAGFAVRAAPAEQWLLSLATREKVTRAPQANETLLL